MEEVTVIGTDEYVVDLFNRLCRSPHACLLELDTVGQAGWRPGRWQLVEPVPAVRAVFGITPETTPTKESHVTE